MTNVKSTISAAKANINHLRKPHLLLRPLLDWLVICYMHCYIMVFMNHLEYLFVSGNICPSAWPNAGKRYYRVSLINVFSFSFSLSFSFFSWDQWPFSAPFEGNSSAPADCCGVDSVLLLTSCFASLVLGFRRPQGCPNTEVESCRIMQRCGETCHHNSSWTSAGMWRIQAASAFNMPLRWFECCTWNMFPSFLSARQMKMWSLEDSAVLSQLITILTLNSSGEIQSCPVPWNLPSKLKQHSSLLVLHHSQFSCSATTGWQTSSGPPRRNLVPGGLPSCVEVREIANLTE